MKTKNLLGAIALFALVFTGCKKDSTEEQPTPQISKMEVFNNDVPFRTEKNLRIGYSIKTWEFAKDGLVLEQIVILDNNTKAELMKIEKADLPKINKNPLPTNPYFKVDSLSSYYLSIQLPIPLNQTVPTSIFHRFIFQDTVKNTTVTVEGAQFTPRTSESPLVIASPVKGKNWMFINQSTYNYHFNAMFFVNGKIGTGERYAFDNLQFDDDGNYFIGDPTKNESYFNYKDTLYAIADGTVMLIQDNLPENDGNSQNIKFNTANELAGNYLILDIGGGHYAFYCHCNPGSFMTKVGRTVKEGDPIALLGNSGNSTAPHLHFQICDSQELFMTNGLPFVLKQYTKVGENGFLTPPSTVYSNSMMEEYSEISFE